MYYLGAGWVVSNTDTLETTRTTTTENFRLILTRNTYTNPTEHTFVLGIQSVNYCNVEIPHHYLTYISTAIANTNKYTQSFSGNYYEATSNDKTDTFRHSSESIPLTIRPHLSGSKLGTTIRINPHTNAGGKIELTELQRKHLAQTLETLANDPECNPHPDIYAIDSDGTTITNQ